MASGYDTSAGNTSSDELPVSISNEITADTWKGQLDFDRACSGADQRCWLCTELTPWNRVLHGLAFELVEVRPGKLRLRHLERNRATDAAEVSFLVSWLLQHHQCIDELKFDYGVHPRCGQKETPFPVRLRPATGNKLRRTIRELEIEGHASAWCHGWLTWDNWFQLEGLDAVSGLERLELDFKMMKPEFDAELAKLLRRNAGSIKKFKICNGKVPRHVTKALRYLFCCESLTISFHNWDRRSPSMDSVARLMHSSTALKELSICPIASRRQMSAIAEELGTNTSLTKLSVRISEWSISPEPVFTALQANTTLQELRVTDCHIGGECGQALALLLQKNTTLRILHIGHVGMHNVALLHLAFALIVNTTLESLHISGDTLRVDGIAALCKVLHRNKTLKKLLFTDISCAQELRVALARQLTEDDCYGRVELPWTEPDLPGLTAALTSPFAGFKELRLPNICCLSMTGLKQLFDALASNKCVRTLVVRIQGDPGEKGVALCKMLKVNRSIECLDLVIDKDEYKFVEDITHTLAENTCITKMRLRINKVCKFETATALSHVLAHNQTATSFFFHAVTSLDTEFVEEFSRGMLQNRTVVKFELTHGTLCGASSFSFFETVRSNCCALNRAADFVVSPSLDRRCAEGFERFSGRPCLLKHLKKVMGKTEPEALLGIAAAERYLRDNYLLITGIVRHSVTCYPTKGTQVDALNQDCWLAIVRHLKIADVLT